MRFSSPTPRMRLSITLFLAIPATVAPADFVLARSQAPAPQMSRLESSSRQPLFTNHDMLLLTVETDLRAVIRDRDSTKAQWHPATLGYAGEGGSSVHLSVELKTRGHWRLDPDHCDFPQLRVDFPPAQPPGSPFAGQDRLKLTTPCKMRRKEYQQYVLREYLVYRLYQMLTPRSFGARLARVTYVDARGRMEPLATYSFFVEDQDRLAMRHGARVIEVEGGKFEDLDADNAGVVSLFQYMIGGTDWSVWGLHNIRLMQDTLNGTVYAVPYDFDWTGLVHTEYAVPDTRLRISSVRQRLYRGQCRTEEQWAPILDQFKQLKDSADALYGGFPDLDPGYVRETQEYFDAFYRVIGDSQSLKREIVEKCRERA